MADKIQQSKQAVLQFFKSSNPQDEFMLINFNQRPGLVSSFTPKFENLQDRLLLVKGSGKTALLDAIYLGLSEMKNASTNRKALFISRTKTITTGDTPKQENGELRPRLENSSA
jgi:Ca-activated chloride channel homolog